MQWTARARRTRRVGLAWIVLLCAGLAAAGETRAPGGVSSEMSSDEALAPFGPAPRGPDGRFRNRGGPIERAGLGVAIPFFARRALTNLTGRDGAPERVPNDGAWLRENARHSTPSVTWVGHATLLVQMGGVTFLTDPIWSEAASPVPWLGPQRYVRPGLAIEDLPPIDFVLVSHNHYDHLDVDSLRRLAGRGTGTRFLVPLGNGGLLRDAGIERVEELDWGGRRKVGAVEILCLPARHWSLRGLGDERRALWSSWAVIGLERRFYFGGDTGYFDGFREIGRELGPFDLAALPIGAYEPRAMMEPWHLNPEQAVRAAADLHAQRALAVHFGTFNLSDEPLDEPPRRFRAAASESPALANRGAWILAVGETRRF